MDQSEKLKQIKKDLLNRWRQQKMIDQLPDVPTNKVDCSDAQKSIWFHEMKEGKTLYSMPIAYQINRRLDPDTVKQTVQIMIDCHDILRTNFIEEAGKIYQIIAPRKQVQFNAEDLSQQAHLLKNRLETIARMTFDLVHDHLFRVYLFQLEQKDILFFQFHHIIADGWSLKVMTLQFVEIYHQIQQGFPLATEGISNDHLIQQPQRFQYKHYSVWAQIHKASFIKHEPFWHQYLSNVPVLHLLSRVGYARPAAFHYKGKKWIMDVPDDLKQILEKTVVKTQRSIFVYGITAFQLLLSIYTNQDDFAIGFPIANRQHHLAETMVGYFVNTLVFRSCLNESSTLAALLLSNHQQLLKLYEHSDYPFIELVKTLNYERNTAFSPIFQTMFIYQDLTVNGKQYEIDMDFMDVDSATTLFDLLLNMYHCNSGLKISLTYYDAIFNKQDIETLLQDYFIILRTLCLAEAKQDNMTLSDFIKSFSAKQLQLYLAANTQPVDKITTIMSACLNGALTLPIRIESMKIYPSNETILFTNLKRNSIYFIYVDIQYEQALIEFELMIASISSALNHQSFETVQFIIFYRSYLNTSSFFQDANDTLTTLSLRLSQLCANIRPRLTFIQWKTESAVTDFNEIQLANVSIQRVIHRIDNALKYIFIDWSYFNPASFSTQMLSQFLQVIQNDLEPHKLRWIICHAPGELTLPAPNDELIWVQDSLNHCLSNYLSQLTSQDVCLIISKQSSFLPMPCPLLHLFPPEDWLNMIYWLSSCWLIPRRELFDCPQIDFSSWLYSEVNVFELPELIKRYDALATDVLNKSCLQENQLEITAAYSETEAKLLKIVQAILAKKQVQLSDNFFQIGGQSLTAVQLTGQIRQIFHIDLSLREFFKQPTFKSLAALIDNAPTQINTTQAPVYELPKHIPLSFTQNRIWFLDQLNINRHAYNMPFLIHMEGSFNVTLFVKAIEYLISNHDIFRTKFAAEIKDVYQSIDRDLPVPIERYVWVHHFEQNQQLQLDTLMQAEVNFHFDLASGFLIRFHLVQCSNTKYFFILNIHHIIADGYTITLIMNELSDAYMRLLSGQGLNASHQVKKQYAHYCIEQQQKPIDYQLTYWLTYLKHYQALELITDYTRPAIHQYHGAYEKFFLPAQILEQIKQFCHREQSSLFAGLLSTFILLMNVFSGQNDIIVGIPAANRLTPETQSMMGLFLNIFAIRQCLTGVMNYRQLLSSVNESVRGAYDHPDVPFELLVDQLKISRDLSQNPLVQVMFNFINIEKPNLKLPFVETSFLEVTRNSSKFDLDFFVEEVGGNLVGIIEYNTDIFGAHKIQQMMACYRYLLQMLTQHPTTVFSSILSCYALNEALIYIQPSDLVVAEATQPSASRLLAKFHESASQFKHKVIIKTPEQSLQYQTLLENTTHIGQQLFHRVSSNNGRIALMMSHPISIMIAMLSVLSIGRAYVVIDVESPHDVITAITESAEICLAITDEVSILENNVFSERFKIISFDCLLNDDEIDKDLPYVDDHMEAYVLYTSGSTGQPKGVIQSHYNLFDHIQRYAQSIRLTDTDVVLQVAQHGTDAGLMDTYAALLNGATLIKLDLKTLSITDLFQQIIETRVTILHMTPTVFSFLLKRAPSSFAKQHHIRAVVFGGEEVTSEVMSIYYDFFTQSCLFVNGFGPTECTTALQYQLNHERFDLKQPRVPIGRPLPGIHIKLLDTQGNDTYFFGEMAISSPNIALGYLGDSSLNENKFIMDETGRRWYKTGDLAYFTHDGYYVYKGRVDSQVKIRGFRVDLLAVESIIVKYPGIKDVAVVCVTQQNTVCLIAYLVVNEDYDETALRNFLKSHLPDYAIPQYCIVRNEIPKTRTGKKDRQALINATEWQQQVGYCHHQSALAPLTHTEIIIQEAWQTVLGHVCTTIHQNFFDAGGHSLLFLELFQRIQSKIQQRFTMMDLYRYPTIHSFATFLDAHEMPIDDYESSAALRASLRSKRKERLRMKRDFQFSD